MENQINVTEFVFSGLLENRQIELLFCFLFLLCYLAVLTGNFIIFLAITSSHLIEQPMYYFLCHLSITDLFYTSTVVPQLIRNLTSERKIISYNNCMAQLFTAHMLAGEEILILVSMAFDHYVAIVKSLHYMVIMNQPRCNILIMMTWVLAVWHSIGLLLIALNLPFCDPNRIDHYICDVKPLLKLASKNIYVFNILVIAKSGMVIGVVFLVLLTFYILYNLRTHTSAR